MKAQFILPLAAILLIGCGQQKQQVREPQESRFYHSLTGNPRLLTRETDKCATPAAPSETVKLRLLISGQPETLTVNALNLFDGDYLRTPGPQKIISETTFGEDLEIIIAGNTYRQIQNSSGRPVSICEKDRSYNTESVENAALIANYYINRTHKLFLKASPGEKVKPVTVRISPAIKRSTGERSARGLELNSAYEADGAYYQVSTSTITFLPQSEDARTHGLHTRFWEIPMVPSHEYAHHLFAHLFGRQLPIDMSQAALNYIYYNNRTVTRASVINAFNEGFADLVSALSLSRREKSLKGIRCLERTREVDSAFFNDDSLKTFNAAARSSFFSSFKEVSMSCEMINYQDPHIFGAIFSFHASQFLKALTSSRQKQLHALSAWANNLGRDYEATSHLSPEEYHEAALLDFYKTSIKVLDRSWDVEKCSLVNEAFAELAYKIPECVGQI